ncbi:6063_t:CDS:2, partial [Entrophospora sp. SA101]
MFVIVPSGNCMPAISRSLVTAFLISVNSFSIVDRGIAGVLRNITSIFLNAFRTDSAVVWYSL